MSWTVVSDMAITLQEKLKALSIERQEKINRPIAELIEQEISFKPVANI